MYDSSQTLRGNTSTTLFDLSPTPHEDSRAVRVLLLSVDADFRVRLASRLAPLRWHLTEAGSGAEALETLEGLQETQILLVDPALPDILPTELNRLVRQSFPHLEILMLDTSSCRVVADHKSLSTNTARVTALLNQDSGPTQARAVIKPAEFLRFPSTGPRLRGIVGDSPTMLQLYSMTHIVAGRDTTVLITGESGTGKDLIAQAIHQVSPRRQSPFIVVNCAAIPEALLEAELFGYAKGAFTGAMQSRIGRIHAAQGGTLFLDEIGDMPFPLQSKLLRFIEQGEVQRLGSNDNLRVDVRVVAATNADLTTLVKQKLFREDLYYRLAIFPIRIAPLRERQQDIPSLVNFFVAKFSSGSTLTPGALEILRRHDWPGNVRELRNVIERASIMAGDSPEISEKDILL